MHEASIMNDLMKKLETVLRAEEATRITGIRVTLGALSHMSPDHFRTHFEAASQGTPMAGARLDIKTLEDVHHPMAQDILLEQVDVEIEQADDEGG